MSYETMINQYEGDEDGGATEKTTIKRPHAQPHDDPSQVPPALTTCVGVAVPKSVRAPRRKSQSLTQRRAVLRDYRETFAVA